MKGRALLIGSQTFGLQGCFRDVALLGDCLERRGFVVECCTGANATRRGILDRYEALISGVDGGDPVVLYYSGHGGLIANPAWRSAAAFDPSVPRFFQFILPTDMAESRDGDFRGILDVELGRLLVRLTARTSNVTVVFDCCHAALMSRDMRPRGLADPWLPGAARHLERIGPKMLEQGRGGECYPQAIRLMAAGRFQSAYEYRSPKFGDVGLFTEALSQALKEAEAAPISWGRLLRVVRERVLAMQPWQRPEVEGPSRRGLFSLEEEKQTAGMLIFFNEGSPIFPRPSLRGGRLQGVEVGNVYALTARTKSEVRLGKATVTQVLGGVSRVRIEPLHLPSGLNAVPLKEILPSLRVALSGEVPPALSRGITRSPLLREVATRAFPHIIVKTWQGRMSLCDGADLVLTQPMSHIKKVLEQLERLARAEIMRGLESGSGANALDITWNLTWGRVIQGEPVPLTVQPKLSCGQRIYAHMVNLSQKTVYVNLIEIGISRRIFILNRSQLSGIELLPQAEHWLGRQPFGGLKGLKMCWPSVVPEEGGQRGSWLAVFSDRPQDLTMLEGEGLGYRKGLSFLQEQLEGLRRGVKHKRMDGESQATDVRYAVQRTDFEMYP